ncbi:MAG TPA: nucleotide exchange factor GrpE [Pyrinomonadaceae bacterium]|jgi:molecular chaperone GrpE|nr:nucleotide exchange factor GrpE [Pyrinomonadaceae bacterium]
MAADKKQKPSNSIPIHFADSDETPVLEEDLTPEDLEAELVALDPDEFEVAPVADSGEGMGGPQLAELIASRAELKRLQSALAEATDTAARRHADFDNYRKRVERDRGETHNRIVADVARKLLPVLDNLSRALDAERTIEAEESKEFRHFLHGVELINKQLNDVLESLGIQPIASVGQRFDPHVHEAVVTEPSDKFEPDTVSEEITRGYRIGDRLLRPAMVKVASRKSDD